MKKTIIILSIWILILVIGHEREERLSSREQALLSIQEDAEKFKLISSELKKDESFLKEALKTNGLVLEYFDAKYKANMAWALLAVKEDGNALKFVSNMLKSDEELVFEAVKEDGSVLKFAHQYLKKDREFVLKLLKNKILYVIDEVDESLQKDKELLELSLVYDNDAFTYIDEELQKDREYISKFLKTNNWLLISLDEKFRKDKELVTMAVVNYAYSLNFADETLQKDKEFLLTLIKKNDKVLKYIDEKLWKDNDFLLEVLKEKGFGLQYATKEQQDNRTLVLKALEYDGYALEFASDNLKKDEALVLKAIDEYSEPLKFSDKSLQENKAFMQKAIEVNAFSITSIDNALKEDKELLLKAIIQNQRVVEYLPKLRKDKAFIVELIGRDLNILPYIDDDLKEDEEILNAVRAFPSYYEKIENILKILALIFLLLFFYFMFVKNKKYLTLLVMLLLFFSLAEILNRYFTHGVFRMPYVMVNETAKFGLERTRCWMNYEENLSRLECYNVHVPEIYDDPKSNVITFPLRIFRSAEIFANTPLLHLGGGGPGANMQLDEDYALEAHLEDHDAFSVKQGRDLFIIDPRGAGLSKPLLTCSTYVDNFLSNMKKEESIEEQYKTVEKDYAQCIGKFKKEKVNFNGYNSFSVAKDINLLTQKIGIEKWVLFGVSYSTTYAMIIAKKYPKIVEKMILDSACFPNLKLDHNYLLQETDSYNALYNYKKNIKESNETKSIDVKSRMWALREKLNKHPLQTNYLELKVNGDDFVASLLYGVYGTAVFKALPQIMDELEKGKLDAFLPYFKSYIGYLMDRTYGDVSSMAHYCYEDKPFIDFNVIKEQISKLPKGYVQYRAILNFKFNDFCKEMDINSTNKTLAEAIKTAIPTLFIHGEFDSITPIRDVLKEMKGFRNSKILIYKTSHAVLGSEKRIEDDVAKFMEEKK